MKSSVVISSSEMSLGIHMVKVRLGEGGTVKEMRVFKFKDLFFGHLTVDAMEKNTDFSLPSSPCDHTPSSGFLGLGLAVNTGNL